MGFFGIDRNASETIGTTGAESRRIGTLRELDIKIRKPILFTSAEEFVPPPAEAKPTKPEPERDPMEALASARQLLDRLTTERKQLLQELADRPPPKTNPAVMSMNGGVDVLLRQREATAALLAGEPIPAGVERNELEWQVSAYTESIERQQKIVADLQTTAGRALYKSDWADLHRTVLLKKARALAAVRDADAEERELFGRIVADGCLPGGALTALSMRPSVRYVDRKAYKPSWNPSADIPSNGWFPEGLGFFRFSTENCCVKSRSTDRQPREDSLTAYQL